MDFLHTYPFTAIVGQVPVKRAILLNLVNPKIGGILLTGEKGTAKTTIIRSIPHLKLGKQVIELPLSVTEEQVVGEIDLEKTLQTGKKQFKPGILQRAHQHILYIDEVNLLPAHLTKMIIDSHSSGMTVVEREGISASYASQSILIGSMNPEEGELPPQILDRFGLYVNVKGEQDIHARTEIIKNRIAFEQDQVSFIQKHQEDAAKLKSWVRESQTRCASITVNDEMIRNAAMIVQEANCEGHRAEYILIETVKAIAALDGREKVVAEDFQTAALYVLPHRQRENQASPSPSEQKNNQEEKTRNSQQNKHETQENTKLEETVSGLKDPHLQHPVHSDQGLNEETPNNTSSSSQEEWTAGIGNEMDIKILQELKAFIREQKQGKGGKRSVVKTEWKQGRYICATIPSGKVTDLALAPTLRAAAPYQPSRKGEGDSLIAIEQQDLRQKVREKVVGTTLLFLVDASGSMGVRKRIEAVKGAIFSLLQDAYRKRDEIGMISFHHKRADVVLEVTRSVEMAYQRLKELPTGGKTPLASALVKGYEKWLQLRKKDTDAIPFLILITDGRANQGYEGKGSPVEEAFQMAELMKNEGILSLIIDTEQSKVPLGLAKKLADHLGGMYTKLDQITSSEIYGAIKEHI
ncbi:VWA domain-containing protein [Lederbergia sp. NSJ-179]|uniref:VWA domain-containing protein n=1 Tax=Lederbergia sp. NSJ-179 TaxID=2931402 RepID=UPI001FD44846|nr:VWA domain-containing protein [Lederbergia sp. NSJ-179]MCJ7842335.1 VWA domain-containing protein [Lederbergia sp. NSJ-179]